MKSGAVDGLRDPNLIFVLLLEMSEPCDQWSVASYVARATE